MKFRTIIRQWLKREEIALHHQFQGKTIGERFRGIRRSERNEAKIFLLALTPIILTAPFVDKWSDESILGRSVVLIAGLWMIGVFIVGGVLVFRAGYRASKKRPD